MVMMEFKNLLIMLGCLVCCMSPCMSQTCIDDELNDQLQCRYGCSDGEIHNKCSQVFDEMTHPWIEGYCCPGFYLTNVTKPTCQRCRDNTFMPDINKCCGCIICMECDGSKNDSILQKCTKTKNKQCKIEQDRTTPANVACPFILTSTGNPPTTKEVNTVQVTSTSDGPVEVHEGKSERKSLYIAVSVESAIILLIIVLFVAFCCCVCYKCSKMKPGEDSSDGRTKIETKSKEEFTEILAAKIMWPIYKAKRRKEQTYSSDDIHVHSPLQGGDTANTGNGDGAIGKDVDETDTSSRVDNKDG